jgi:hypothetical protein
MKPQGAFGRDIALTTPKRSDIYGTEAVEERTKQEQKQLVRGLEASSSVSWRNSSTDVIKAAEDFFVDTRPEPQVKESMVANA